MSGKGPEQQIGLMLLYFFISQDDSLMLTNDRKVLQTPTWDEVKKYFSNCGKVVQALKKLRDFIDNDQIQTVHFK